MKTIWQHLERHKDRAIYRFYPNRVKSNVNLWRSKFPGIQPYYAIKSNNYPQLISQLASQGCSFDCASMNEMKQVLGGSGEPSPPQNHTYQKGKGLWGNVVSPPQIIFANPMKMPSHLTYAKKHGVRLMTADSGEELEKIAHYYPTAETLLRIAVDDSQSLCKFNKKFGLQPLQSSLIPSSNLINFFEKHHDLKKKLGNPYMLPISGVSFHVGSGCLSAKSYQDALEKSQFVFNFAEKYGVKMNILDIGGGFIQKEPLLTDVSETIYRELKKWPKRPGRIIAEPGRFMSANVFDLYVKVIGKKRDHSGFKYYVNNSVYGAFNCKIFDYATFQFDIYNKVSQKPFFKNEAGQWKTYDGIDIMCSQGPSTIFGATCDSLDVILENINIPELNIGDYLCFHNMGAYTYSASSQFNGIPHPVILAL